MPRSSLSRGDWLWTVLLSQSNPPLHRCDVVRRIGVPSSATGWMRSTRHAACDPILVATTVYWRNVTAQLKALF
jgi:hypothetical protein